MMNIFEKRGTGCPIWMALFAKFFPPSLIYGHGISILIFGILAKCSKIS